MSNFTIKDVTTGKTTSSNGTSAIYDGVRVKELNLAGSSDTYQITASCKSDVAVLTGSGNDTINVAGVSAMSFVNAGAGSNVITGGTGDMNITESAVSGTVPYSQPYTFDTIANFHASDNFVFEGAGLTGLMTTVRGTTTCYAAWNPAVAGSALDANFTGLPPGEVLGSITSHA